MDIYQFVRVLGFSAEYVEKITPNEREIFKGIYKTEMKEKQNNESNYSLPNTIGTPIDIK